MEHFNKLSEKNIITINDKKKLKKYMNDNHLVFEVKTVQAIGHKGSYEMVQMNDSDLFTCSGCKEYCVKPYYGNDDIGMCYDCIM